MVFGAKLVTFSPFVRTRSIVVRVTRPVPDFLLLFSDGACRYTSNRLWREGRNFKISVVCSKWQDQEKICCCLTNRRGWKKKYKFKNFPLGGGAMISLPYWADRGKSPIDLAAPRSETTWIFPRFYFSRPANFARHKSDCCPLRAILSSFIFAQGLWLCQWQIVKWRKEILLGLQQTPWATKLR